MAFADFAGRMSRARSRANAADLYLACACSDANPLALAEFERRFIGRVRDVVVRIDSSYDFVAEVEQILRERLLVGPRPDPRLPRRGRAHRVGADRRAAHRPQPAQEPQPE